MKINYSGEAIKNLQSFSKKEQIKIRDKMNYLAENYEILKNSKNITALVNFSNIFRYRISSDLRAIFELKNNEIIIHILKIGFRKDIYD